MIEINNVLTEKKNAYEENIKMKLRVYFVLNLKSF